MRISRSANALIFTATIGLTALNLPAGAQDLPYKIRTDVTTNMFDVDYVPPKNPAHLAIYNTLKQQRLLEKMQEFLSPVRLPERITLKVEGCDGNANAYFWDNAVKVCYEYFEFLGNHAPKTSRHGLSPQDAMVGATVDVFLHETGHAVVEILDIPFFGREEEVADYFATYTMLQFPKDEARRLILGASFIGGNEAMKEQGKAPELRLIADTHSLPAQRYFNRWCMAYGADPELFADAIDVGMLPENRAKRCRYEYKTNDYAFKTLIGPYIDDNLGAKIRSRHWFTFDTPLVADATNKPTGESTQEERKSPPTKQ